jgi:hypothetical protein
MAGGCACAFRHLPRVAWYTYMYDVYLMYHLGVGSARSSIVSVAWMRSVRQVS